MISKEFRIRKDTYHAPIAMLISIANSFLCEIHISSEQNLIDVKNYEEMKAGLVTSQSCFLFLFNGEDENEAKEKVGRFFD